MWVILFVVQSYAWLIPSSKSNQVVTDNWLTKIKYEFDKDENAHYYHRSIKYEGKVKNNREVYYLVGPNTGSAADTYISMIKENNLGTIVGSYLSKMERIAENTEFVYSKLYEEE